jgi:hypothetical protein
MIIRNRTKMRSADSLFKDRPGASKIVVHCRTGFQNTATGLSDDVVTIHQKPIFARKYSRLQDVVLRRYGIRR